MDNGPYEQQSISIIGKCSFEFVADALCQGSIVRLNSLDFREKYVLLFFYVADFSTVCFTEMFALQDALPEFEKRNVEVLGISVDPAMTHCAWVNTARSQGGIEGITFTLISDVQKKISRAYGILDEKKGSCLRGTFILDKDGVVQHASVNLPGIGRNIQELLRIVDAIQYTEKCGELCPVDWHSGDAGIAITKVT